MSPSWAPREARAPSLLSLPVTPAWFLVWPETVPRCSANERQADSKALGPAVERQKVASHTEKPGLVRLSVYAPPVLGKMER